MRTAAQQTSNVLRFATKPKKPRAKRKTGNEWRSVARSWRIKDGRNVIVLIPLAVMGEDGARSFKGEAYWHDGAASWWLANTSPDVPGCASIADVFGCGPELWHPMPSDPPVPAKKTAVSRKVKRVSKRRAN